MTSERSCHVTLNHRKTLVTGIIAYILNCYNISQFFLRYFWSNKCRIYEQKRLTPRTLIVMFPNVWRTAAVSWQLMRSLMTSSLWV